MKKQLLLSLFSALLLVCLNPMRSVGQILTFEFSALAGNEATAASNSNDAGLTASTISRGAGLTASANVGRYNATSWALTSIANAVSGDDYMEFTITPNVGKQFTVSSIYIQLQRSGTGNTAIALRSSVDGYTTNLDGIKAITDNTSTQNFTFTFAQANSSSAVTYRFYSYAEAIGGSGGIGDGAGNDIVVAGTVTNASSTPTVNLSVSASTGTEAGTTVITATATASAAVAGAQTVNIAATGTGITAGDYTLSNTSITVANAATTGTVTFTVVNDAVYECTETATLTISNPSAGIVLGSTTTRTVTITDNDFPTVNLSINTATGSEAATTSITLTATASAAVIGAQTVSVALTGTGLTNADFSGITFPATITIANAATTGTRTFTIVDDSSIEGDESATFTISSPSSCVALGATTTQGLTIVENDFPAPPCAELFISEYLEGSSSNKYIEIYNPTASAINLGTGNYSLRLYSNGASSPSSDVALSGTLAAYSTLVLSNSSATIYVGTTTDNASVNFNGDDAVALAKNGVNIDIFGRIGDDPGTRWILSGNSTSDQTLVRKPTVQAGIDVSPSGTGPSAFITLSTEWNQFAQDVVSNLGSHTCDCFVNLPVVTLTTNLTAGTEAASTAFTLTATADVAVTGNQTVNVVLTGTAGIAPSDFTGADFTSTVSITILSGNTTGVLNLAVNDDAAVEPLETATFTIGTPSAGVVIGTPAAVNFAITDNDNLVSSLSVVDGIGNEAASISSVINGTINNNTDGTQVWQFNLYDGDGTNNDADTKPTIYEGFTIRQSGGNTVPAWNNAIDNVKFFLGASATPISGSFLVSANTITFTPSTSITVADGTAPAQISMRLTLDVTLPSGSDGQHFGFSIDDSDVTVDTDVLTYSQLGTFSEQSNAALNGIDITATLQFMNAPTAVSVGSNFSITVSAVDANGNVDTGVSSSITLTHTSGSGTLTGAPVTLNLVSGTRTFTGLSHDTQGTIQITASGGSYSSVIATINVTNDPFQLFDDFNRVNSNSVGMPSSETITSYSEVESGNGTKTRIENNLLLIANCNSDGSGGNQAMEQVMFNVENRHETVYSNAGSSLQWLFNMKQSRSNPSGFDNGNYASGVILGSDQLNVNAAGADGYAVILGNSLADQIRLVRFTNGLTANSNVTVIVQTLDVAPADYFSIKVTYNPCDGAWTLSARNDGSVAFSAPQVGSLGTVFTGTDPSPHTALDLKYFGMIWNHQNSCTETALFDNVSIPNATSATTTAKLWNGSISADWNVAGNWGPCPGVPTNLQNVIIPNVTTQPIVSAAAPAATCKDLTVNVGADLTINASRFLNVWGNLVNNGTTAFGAGTLTMEGTGTLTLTGNVNVANYHVSTNVTLNGTVTVSGTARSEVGGALTANGNLVLLNGAQLLHGVGTTSGGGSVTGNIVVKRQGNASGGFNGWSTPVVGGILPGSNGYSYDSGDGTNSNLDDNNPLPDPGWDAHSGGMAAGKGYFSQNGGLATFTGVANNASYTPSVTGSPELLTSQVAPTFFNLIGNPYPSAISANQFINDNSARIDGTIYFWADENSGPTAYSQNDYASYTLNGGVPTVAGGSGPVPNGSIPSCQGFFVNCDASGTINFNNGQRGGNNSQFFRMAALDAQRIWLSINNDNLGLFNQTLVGFDEFATDQKDWGMDAYKLRGNQNISIGAQQDGETYVIATYEAIPQSGKIVPLMTYVETAGTYTFVADSMEGFDNRTVYLEDLSNGSLYPLEQGGSYSFAMTSADEFGRFQLWFSPLTITGVDEASNDLRIYATNDMVVVENTSGESVKGIVQITDMAGRMVLSNDLTISNGIGRLQTTDFANCIYVVSFVSLNGNQSIAQKVTLGQ